MTDASQVKSFRNMNELTSYLSSMEIRLATLESENKGLRNALGQVKQSAAAQTFKTERSLPDTGLVSDTARHSDVQYSTGFRELPGGEHRHPPQQQCSGHNLSAAC